LRLARALSAWLETLDPAVEFHARRSFDEAIAAFGPGSSAS
jgi:hypothetical protein